MPNIGTACVGQSTKLFKLLHPAKVGAFREIEEFTRLVYPIVLAGRGIDGLDASADVFESYPPPPPGWRQGRTSIIIFAATSSAFLGPLLQGGGTGHLR